MTGGEVESVDTSGTAISEADRAGVDAGGPSADIGGPYVPGGPVLNTDRELYREPGEGPGMEYYANSVHVTQDGEIGMNAGGLVITLPIATWHEYARAGLGIPSSPHTGASPEPDQPTTGASGSRPGPGLHPAGTSTSPSSRVSSWPTRGVRRRSEAS